MIGNWELEIENWKLEILNWDNQFLCRCKTDWLP